MISQPHERQIVWLDGSFVQWHAATMHVSDHHYGVGVFEGVRAYAAADGVCIFRLKDHTKRLFRSAHMLRMAIPDKFGPECLNDVQIQLIRQNGLSNAYIRPFIFRGGVSGLSPRVQDLQTHIAIMALEWNEGAHRTTAKTQGLALRTSSFPRPAAGSLLSKAKANANYINGILAFQEAQLSGADDALLLDQQGFVVEATASNVFVVRDGVLYTPSRESALEGVTRDSIIKLAATLGWTVAYERITRDDVYSADEAFLTGTAIEVTPIRELDGRRIGAGRIGPITERLQTMYAEHVRGRGEHHREWITRV